MTVVHDAYRNMVVEFTSVDEFNAHTSTVRPAWNEPQVARRIDSSSRRIMASLLYSADLGRWV